MGDKNDAMVNPYLQLGVAGAGVVTDIIGMIMQKQATDEAMREAKAIDTRNFAYQQKRDVQSDKFTKESLKQSKEKLGLDKALTMHGLNKDKVAQVEKFFNNNIGMQDRLLKLWGA
jgi:hypothetical protein